MPSSSSWMASSPRQASRRVPSGHHSPSDSRCPGARRFLRRATLIVAIIPLESTLSSHLPTLHDSSCPRHQLASMVVGLQTSRLWLGVVSHHADQALLLLLLLVDSAVSPEPDLRYVYSLSSSEGKLSSIRATSSFPILKHVLVSPPNIIIQERFGKDPPVRGTSILSLTFSRSPCC